MATSAAAEAARSGPATTGSGDEPARRHRPVARWRPAPAGSGWAPAAAHGATLAAGLLVLVWVNRGNWFFGDDWAFIDRPALRPWDPWIDHWSTLPLLGYRALVAVFGIGTMWPYLLWCLLAHLGAAHLAWRTARHAGADAWVATALTATFIVLGSGAENLTWTFQSTTNSAVLLGYGAVVLVDRRRSGAADLGAAALLLAAVMTSNVGVFLLVAVALLAGSRDGPRRAARVGAAPAAAFALWYALAGRAASANDPVTATTVLRIPEFVANAVARSFEGTVGITGAGAVLALGLLAWLATRPDLRGGAAAPVALAAGAALLFAAISIGRYDEQHGGLSSRYIYLMVAFLLPLLAVALSDAVRRAPTGAAARPVLLGALVLLAVHNVGTLRQWATDRVAFVGDVRTGILASAWLARTGEPLLDRHAAPGYSPDLDVDRFNALADESAVAVPEPAPGALLEARRLRQVAVGPARSVPGTFRLDGDPVAEPVPGEGDCRAFVRPAGGEIVLRPDGPTAAAQIRGGPGAVAGLAVRAPDGRRSTGWEVAVDTGPTVNVVAPGHDLVVALPAGRTVVCGVTP